MAQIRQELAEEELRNAAQGLEPVHDVSFHVFLHLGLELETAVCLLSCITSLNNNETFQALSSAATEAEDNHLAECRAV